METLSASKYTNKLIGNTAFMLLNRTIGISTPEEQCISGEAFAAEMYDWKGQGKDVTVKINSLGGNVYRGWDMVDSIIETRAKTEVIGFAYSMAGLCLIVGSDRTAYPHSRGMIHAPRRSDGKKDFHTDLIKDQFRTILKNHTKFTEAEINEMVDSGKDYFFDAKQMLEKGMIDRISSTGGYNNDVMGLPEKDVYLYINKQFEQETNNEMEGLNKIWAKLTGKESDAEQIVAFTEMKASNLALTTSKAEADAKITTLEAKVAAYEAEKAQGDVKVKASALIEAAVKAGKFPGIKDDAKAKLIEGAVANFDATKLMIDAIAPQKTVAAAVLPKTEGKEGDQTYEWLAKNNEKELNRIAIEEPELFAKLSADYIAKSKEPKEN